MNYIVIDTEFNQPSPQLFNPDTKFKPNKICPFELIEIGAIKLNENLDQIDTFRIFIKPVIYYSISPIVTRKTKIKMKDLKYGLPLTHAIEQFIKWIGDEDYLLCTWSDNDIRILKENCKYHEIDHKWVDNYFDIQLVAAKYFDLPKGQVIGLKKAMKRCGINTNEKLHRALIDAFYTAEIFRKIRNSG